MEHDEFTDYPDQGVGEGEGGDDEDQSGGRRGRRIGRRRRRRRKQLTDQADLDPKNENCEAAADPDTLRVRGSRCQDLHLYCPRGCLNIQKGIKRF